MALEIFVGQPAQVEARLPLQGQVVCEGVHDQCHPDLTFIPLPLQVSSYRKFSDDFVVSRI